MSDKKILLRIEGMLVIIILLTIAGILIAFSGNIKEKPEGTEYNKPTVRVYMAGEVAHPGVYELEHDKRVIDAIEAAGGVTETGDASSLDLAEFLVDGQTLRVASAAAASEAPIVLNAPAEKAKININTATTEELQKLSGIGEGLAERIVEYRTANGEFRSIEEIQNVSGISEKRFDAIKNMITV